MNNHQGFLLCEILVAMVCAVFVVGLSGVLFPSLYRIPVDLEAWHLQATCLYLQGKARCTNQKQTLTFNEDVHAYGYEGSLVPLAPQVRFGALPGVLGPPSSATRAIVHPITFTDKEISFFPQGGIDSGSVYFVDNAQRYQAAVTVGIAAIGYVRMYRYTQEGQWRINKSPMPLRFAS